MPRLISNTEYLFILFALAIFTTGAGVFAAPLEFTTTASVSAVTMFSLFLSELEFKEQAEKVLATQISISMLSHALMYLHTAIDWL